MSYIWNYMSISYLNLIFKKIYCLCKFQAHSTLLLAMITMPPITSLEFNSSDEIILLVFYYKVNHFHMKDTGLKLCRLGITAFSLLWQPYWYTGPNLCMWSSHDQCKGALSLTALRGRKWIGLNQAKISVLISHKTLTEPEQFREKSGKRWMSCE